MVFGLSRHPEKYEERALQYERKGNMKKATKNREKAAKIRAKAGHGVGTSTVVTQTVTPIGQPLTQGSWQSMDQALWQTSHPPARYEQQAVKWEGRNNYQKAQKNREKVWRLQNPQHATVAAPSFYNNNSFVGYNAPVSSQPIITGQTLHSQPIIGGQTLSQPFGTQRTTTYYEQKAMRWEGQSNWQKAQRNREKAWRLQYPQHATTTAPSFYSNNTFVGYSVIPTATPGSYAHQSGLASWEQKALRYEQQGNWEKARRNREKAWRHHNPQHASHGVPNLYDSNNRFLGYNVPFTQQTITQTTHQTLAPTVETHVRPTVIDQTIRHEKITEIQPIVHREVTAPQVHVIEKHIYETVPSTGPSTVTKAAIVEETVRPRIIEEVQPIIHREVPAPFVERVEQHTTEHISQPTVTTREVVHGQTVVVGQTQSAFGIPRTHSYYEQKAVHWESQKNWKKAQRNREKVWRLQNPQHATTLAPSFYNNNVFTGYSVVPTAAAGSYTPLTGLPKWEQKALKYEQKGKWEKARKNRERAWRHHNPQHANGPAPSLYDSNNRFLGYNVPHQPAHAHGSTHHH